MTRSSLTRPALGWLLVALLAPVVDAQGAVRSEITLSGGLSPGGPITFELHHTSGIARLNTSLHFFEPAFISAQIVVGAINAGGMDPPLPAGWTVVLLPVQNPDAVTIAVTASGPELLLDCRVCTGSDPCPPSASLDVPRIVSGHTWTKLETVVAYGCGVNPPESLTLVSGSPTIGTTLTLGVDNPLGTQPLLSVALLCLSFAADPAFPCGTLKPRFGQAGPGAVGELLLDFKKPNHFAFLSGGMWAGPASPSPIFVPIPPDATLAGLRFYAQGAIFDSTGGGIRLGMTNGLEFLIGL